MSADDPMLKHAEHRGWVAVTETGGVVLWGRLVAWRPSKRRRQAEGDVMFANHDEGEFLTYPADRIEAPNIGAAGRSVSGGEI